MSKLTVEMHEQVSIYTRYIAVRPVEVARDGGAYFPPPLHIGWNDFQVTYPGK